MKTGVDGGNGSVVKPFHQQFLEAQYQETSTSDLVSIPNGSGPQKCPKIIRCEPDIIFVSIIQFLFYKVNNYFLPVENEPKLFPLKKYEILDYVIAQKV